MLIIDRLKKINELALRGVDGEKETAKLLLDKLLKQYGLTETDLLDEKTETRIFSYNDICETQFLMNIIEVTNNKALDFYIKRKKKKLLVDLTEIEYIQTLEVVKFYTKLYKKEIVKYKRNLTAAILQKYDLYSSFVEEVTDDNKKKSKKKSKIDWNLVLSLINDIEATSHRKQINGK